MTVAEKVLPRPRFKYEDLDGRVREYEFRAEMSVRDAMFLQEKSGATIATLAQYIDRREPAAIVATVFLHKRANGEAVRYEDLLDTNIMSFQWFNPGVELCPNCGGHGLVETSPPADAPEQSEVDPTTPAGRPRRKGTTKTD